MDFKVVSVLAGAFLAGPETFRAVFFFLTVFLPLPAVFFPSFRFVVFFRVDRRAGLRVVFRFTVFFTFFFGFFFATFLTFRFPAFFGMALLLSYRPSGLRSLIHWNIGPFTFTFIDFGRTENMVVF